jgi:indolepyruvate ferredoxin oxidoreductase
VPTPDAWLGIMTTGKTYYDVRQALVELGLNDESCAVTASASSRWGCSFPMEPRVVREFARGLEEILVVEEKRSFIEMFAKDTLYGMPDRPRIVGKRDEEDRLLVPSWASSTPTRSRAPSPSASRARCGWIPSRRAFAHR